METKFNFNSQVCTDKVQSERLLALGLKRETADMCWQTTTLNGKPITYPAQDVWLNGSIITNNHFPAWSLHRLIEMMPEDISNMLWFSMGKQEVNYDSIHYIKNFSKSTTLYDNLIDCIEWLIKEGYFNKEYLV